MAHKGYIGNTAIYDSILSQSPYNSYDAVPRVAVRPIRRITRSMLLPAGLMEASANRCTATLSGGVGDGTARRWLQGVVKEAGVPVSRTLTVHRRDTQAVIARASSMLDGKFTVSWQGYSGKVFLVVFDDIAAGADYNCQIVDLLDSIS